MALMRNVIMGRHLAAVRGSGSGQGRFREVPFGAWSRASFDAEQPVTQTPIPKIDLGLFCPDLVGLSRDKQTENCNNFLACNSLCRLCIEVGGYMRRLHHHALIVLMLAMAPGSVLAEWVVEVLNNPEPANGVLLQVGLNGAGGDLHERYVHTNDHLPTGVRVVVPYDVNVRFIGPSGIKVRKQPGRRLDTILQESHAEVNSQGNCTTVSVGNGNVVSH